MSRKLELRTRMAEIQKEYSVLNTEVKDLDEVDRRIASHEKFKDYKYKVGMFGAKLYDEEQIQEVSNQDREEAVVGKSGIAYTNSETTDGYCCLMMKQKPEYARFKLLLERLEAAKAIQDGHVDKEKFIKVILGESTENDKVR